MPTDNREQIEADNIISQSIGNTGKETNFILRILYVIAVLLGLKDNPVFWVADSIHTPNTDRTIVTTRHPIRDSGILTNVYVRIVSGTLTRDLYCKILLEDENQNVISELARGYLDSSTQIKGNGSIPIQPNYYLRLDSWGYVTCTLKLQGQIIKGKNTYSGGWSGTDEGSLTGQGQLNTLTATNPPAYGTGDVGGGLVEQVTTGTRIHIKNSTVIIVTSATAANREAIFAVTDGVTSLMDFPSGVAQTATQTITYHFVPTGEAPRAGAIATNVRIISIPNNLVLNDLHYYAISLNTPKMGDNIGAMNFFIERWIDI